VSPRPAEPVEYWIGASARVSIDRAARIADGWLASPSLTLNRAREQADWYRDACAKYGKTPAAVAIRRDIYVGESSAEAEAVGRAVVKAAIAASTPPPSCGLGRGGRREVPRLRAPRLHDIIVRHIIDNQAKVVGSLGRLAEVGKALRKP